MLKNLPIEELSSIGPVRGSVLREEAGIATVEDLIYYAPRRYLDRSSFLRIADCVKGQQITVAGTVASVRIEGGGRMLAVQISDETDSLSGIFFGGIRYMQKRFAPGDEVVFSGTVDIFRGRKQIVHPEFDFYGDDPSERVNTGRIIPLYHSNETLQKSGFSSRGFRKIIIQAIRKYLDQIDDPIPSDIRSRLSLPEYASALKSIHFPESMNHIDEARMRLAFNELFFLQYYLHLTRRILREKQGGSATVPDMRWCADFFNKLPFQLTEDQQQTINRISLDISQPFEMNRLVQGDVGSGKTAVAMAAACIVKGLGRQTAVMAPTEVLALQHYEGFTRSLPDGVRCELLISAMPAAKKKKAKERILSGDADIAIGTHALIQDSVDFHDLGLVVVDEQHRFGVEQRAQLRKKGSRTDLLVMTATPIPRSLALTAYGDLDVSIIKEKPAHRIPIKTLVLPESRISGVYTSMEKYIAEGRQCYYVLPLIEESAKSDLTSAKEVYEDLSTSIFSHRRVGLLHGRMKQDEKSAVMTAFRDGSIDILVSTTVIEVGIDVPNASVIVIHHPERFGLSQLHQLRGRVGRSVHQSFCVLLHPDGIGREIKDRLAILAKSEDGFSIAEEDLKLRGAGDFLGTRQHGLASQFEFADLARDLDLLLKARAEAENIVSQLSDADEGMRLFEKKYIRSGDINGSRLAKSLSLIS
jgi:ATP-dependent DNA helicase RecG